MTNSSRRCSSQSSCKNSWAGVRLVVACKEACLSICSLTVLDFPSSICSQSVLIPILDFFQNLRNHCQILTPYSVSELVASKTPTFSYLATGTHFCDSLRWVPVSRPVPNIDQLTHQIDVELLFKTKNHDARIAILLEPLNIPMRAGGSLPRPEPERELVLVQVEFWIRLQTRLWRAAVCQFLNCCED